MESSERKPEDLQITTCSISTSAYSVSNLNAQKFETSFSPQSLPRFKYTPHVQSTPAYTRAYICLKIRFL